MIPAAVLLLWTNENCAAILLTPDSILMADPGLTPELFPGGCNVKDHREARVALEPERL